MRSPGKHGPVRKKLSTVLGWLQLALILAPYFALILKNFVLSAEDFDKMPRHLWTGLLFIVPIALSWFAVKYLRHIAVYILASLAITGVTFVLFGSVIPAIVAAVLCFFRVYGRMVGEKRSLLDHATYPGALIVALPALLSLFVDRIHGAFQTVGLLFTALYLLIVVVQKGIEHIDGYVETNRALANFPERRIIRLLSAVLAVMALAAGLVMLPPLAMNGEVTRVDLSLRKPVGTAAPTPTPEAPEMPAGGMGGLEALGEIEANPYTQAFFRILEYIVFAAMAVFLIAAAIFAAIRISRSFRSSYDAGGDYVENLREDDPDVTARTRMRRFMPWPIDLSPSAVIRRRWRKAVRRGAKEPPLPSMSPAEAEAHAGLSGEAAEKLHVLYEKARYSENGADRADLKG